MKLKRTMLAVLAGTAVVASVPALADGGRHDGRGHWNRYHGHHYAPRPLYVTPPGVVYAPQVIYPAPVYYRAPRYYQPAPRYYPPAPVYAPSAVSPGVSIHFRLPL